MATSLTQYDVVHHTRAQELPAQVPGRLHGGGRGDTETPDLGELLAAADISDLGVRIRYCA